MTLRSWFDQNTLAWFWSTSSLGYSYPASFHPLQITLKEKQTISFRIREQKIERKKMTKKRKCSEKFREELNCLRSEASDSDELGKFQDLWSTKTTIPTHILVPVWKITKLSSIFAGIDRKARIKTKERGKQGKKNPDFLVTRKRWRWRQRMREKMGKTRGGREGLADL